MEPEDYKYIWAYGKIMASMDYYIVARMHEAAEDNAPATAYRKDGDGWATLEELGNETMRMAVEEKAKQYPGPSYIEEYEEEDEDEDY